MGLLAVAVAAAEGGGLRVGAWWGCRWVGVEVVVVRKIRPNDKLGIFRKLMVLLGTNLKKSDSLGAYIEASIVR